MRKPELHDVLHDGLVLTRKNPGRFQGGGGVKAKRNSSSRSRSASRSASRARAADENNFNRTNDSSLFHTVSHKSRERNVAERPSRSLTPSSHAHRLGVSLNKNLNQQNSRHSSLSRSPSNSSRMTHNRTYDILPEAGDMGKKSDSSLGKLNELFINQNFKLLYSL